jgi:uncharacterized protein YodC (DUF2158 family)
MNELKIGHIVTLKGQSQPMTITEIEADNGHVCQWFDKAKKLNTATFPAEALEIFLPQKPEEDDEL